MEAFGRTKVKEERREETAFDTVSGSGGKEQIPGNIKLSLTIFYKYLEQT